MRRLLAPAVAVALALPLLGSAPAGATAPPSVASAVVTTSARSLLSKIVTAPETGSTTYVRALFPHWVDANRDCQNARTEILIAESKIPVTYTSSSRCAVRAGRWYSYYDGRWWTNPADVDIDHMVPLKEAWESGARTWTTAVRQAYANDLGFVASLEAVTDNVNQSKGDKDPAAWLPPRTSVRCIYAIRWVQVKYRWRLTMDAVERAALYRIINGACGATIVPIPTRAR